ncbi:MAG: ubiquitin-like small modifier protein 1 [Dehalococcoidia bacterium]
MAKFKFHGTLQNHLPARELFVDGNRTVAESLAVIADAHPALKASIYEHGHNRLHEYIIVVLNDEQVEFLDDGLDTRLSDDDTVQVFPPVSGGVG